jgi:hypothetical protein
MGSMIAIAAAAAIAIDMGMLMMIRTESQRAADASALAGASALITDPDDSVGAVDLAIEYAARNTIRGTPAQVLAEDVQVILDSAKVRVFVQNTAARNNAISTYFARVVGIPRVDVRTMATAEAAPANSVDPGGDVSDCLLPIGLVDFQDSDGDGFYTPGVDPALGITQTNYHGTLFKLSFSGSTGTGPPYCRTEPGEVFNGTPNVDYCNGFEDSWSCWWQEGPSNAGGSGGSTDLGAAILGTSCPAINIPQTVYQASGGGEKQSLVSSDDAVGGPGSFRDLVEQRPNERWCPDGDSGSEFGCVKNGPCASSTCVTSSPRIRVAPIIDREGITGSGANNNFMIDQVVGVFIERVACSYSAGDFGGPAGNWNVYIRLMTAAAPGTGPGEGEGGESESLYRYLRLIE